MEVCAIPSLEAVDIESLILHDVAPDMPFLSGKEKKMFSSLLSNQIKNKLNGVGSMCEHAVVDTVAELLCDNINNYVLFRHTERVIVCLETGECLIEGIFHGY